MVDQADDVQHALMLRLTFYTGVRVSELCGIEVSHVDLENCKIFVDQGKGSKDRYVLFGKSFATALRRTSRPTPITGGSSKRSGTRSSRPGGFSKSSRTMPRRRACRCTPHTFRHQAITWLTRHSGMADAELATHHGPREAGNAGRLPARCLGRRT